MHIYKSAHLHKMPLIIAAHNDKDIVVASDTRATVDIDGKPQPHKTNQQKIYSFTPKCALAFTGYFLDTTLQFIEDFVDDNQGTGDPLEIFDKLYAKKGRTLTLRSMETLQLIVLGFEHGKPWIKSWVFSGSEKDRMFIPESNFYTAGYDKPKARAKILLGERGIENPHRTSDMKQIVKTTIAQCIAEFPDELAGTPDVYVLHRD